MALRIRKAGTKDIPQIRSLFNAYTAPPKPARFFHWWRGIPSVTFCAQEGDRLVGLFVVLRRRLTNGVTCGVLMGLIVDSRWRGSGLFGELGREAMNHFGDLDMFCCLTNPLGRRALEKNFDFRTIGDIETMVRVGRARTEDRHSPRIAIGPDTRLVPVRGGKTGDTLLFLADEDFRRWRYALHPRCTYHVVRRDSDEFAIVNQYRDPQRGVTYGDIVDFEAASLDEDRLAALLDEASSDLAREVDLISIQAIPKSPLHGIVKKMGFAESGCRHHFCVKVKRPEDDAYLYEASRWLIKWGDYLR